MRRHGRFVSLPFGTIVLAFMALSLAITATGTARFAVAIGYPPEVGYAIGGVFDFAKALLPVGLILLLARRSVLLFVIIGAAWLCLVTYSSLATHATVSSAIAAIERSGTWKMEVRSDTKAELAAVESRLAVVSQPIPPRPSKTLVEGLASESVPPGAWRDSQECQNIRGSRYFQAACQKVLDLRRELAVAQDYERLDARARELRQALAAAPPVATSDPLPQAFAATLGRFLPLDGHGGIALLLTLIVEIMSCFGFAGLRALKRETGRGDKCARDTASSLQLRGGRRLNAVAKPQGDGPSLVQQGRPEIVPTSSLKALGHRSSPNRGEGRDRHAAPPSKFLPARGTSSQTIRNGEESIRLNGKAALEMGSHLPEFVRERLQPMEGASLGATELKEA